MDSDGSVWEWNGAVCSGNVCPHWTQVDSGATQIFAAGRNLYEVANQGNFSGLFQFGGEACWNPVNCEGWTQIDSDVNATCYVADNYVDKVTWYYSYSVFQYAGQLCALDNCAGWQQIESNMPAFYTLATGMTGLYQLSPGGSISVLDGCSNAPCQWSPIGDNTNSAHITAGNYLYQL